MPYLHEHLFPFLWTLWLIYWIIAAGKVKAATRRESIGSYVIHMAPLLLAAYLLVAPERRNNLLFETLWPRTDLTFWLGAVLLVAGFAFSIWARLNLGRNWSGNVTIKKDHELIQTGPYRFVRHPIYSGLLLAFLGSAVALDEWRGLLAFGLVLVAFTIKSRIEERWMTELFGPAYRHYQQRVRMLIPLIW